MLDLQALPFLGVVTEMRHLIVVLDRIDDPEKNVEKSDRDGVLLNHVAKLTVALTSVGARSALASSNRLQHALENNAPLDYQGVRTQLSDIESRFADHLNDIKLFVLSEQEAKLFDPANNLLAFQGTPVEGFSLAYPKAAFEIEEAAKCIAFERYTASVFHCMRALECGIHALSKFLSIPNPAKASEKNWGIILGKIQERLDEKWPKSTRLPNSEGSKIELIYAHLDAVKNPWRNATMHVETIYMLHEAIHIARCTGMFFLELLKHCDEEGRTATTAPAMATIGREQTEPAA